MMYVDEMKFKYLNPLQTLVGFLQNLTFRIIEGQDSFSGMKTRDF